MATVYQCIYRHTNRVTAQCSSANQGKRAKCVGCKSTVSAITGHAVLIPWTGTGRYRLEDAVREFSTVVAADRAAANAYGLDNESNLVSRFLTEG